ncbi:MAG: hypothetical protein L0H37_10160, partial [Nitrosospira sp.]|nr:hypothetical protein [Nitrosospira sp.]
MNFVVNYPGSYQSKWPRRVTLRQPGLQSCIPSSDYAFANPTYKSFVILAKAGIQTLTGTGRH